jgi:hypothetical protein
MDFISRSTASESSGRRLSSNATMRSIFTSLVATDVVDLMCAALLGKCIFNTSMGVD